MKQLLLLLLLPLAGTAQQQSPGMDTYMQGQAKLYGFNGNVLVAKNGQVVYRKSFGYADYATKQLLDSNSVFDCGSIAKEFTAMGILLLKDKGRLSYNDTLTKFFPELPYNNVTIQQLLTHTSGMADGFDLVSTFSDHRRVAQNADLLRLLAREKPPLFFKPGEQVRYSGTGFNLLACIIEKLSGQSYAAYMEQQVFNPLGLLHTRVANSPRNDHTIPGLAYGYEYNDSLKIYKRADSDSTGWTTWLTGITGEGMIVTTAGDLLRWDRALKNSSLLNKTTQQQMLSLQATNTLFKINFGYGMRVGKNDIGEYIFHNGSYPGYLSMHIRYTSDDITVIVLSNNESQAPFIADALASIALNKQVAMPTVHKAAIKNAALLNYSGKYMMRLTRPPYMALFPVEFLNTGNTFYIHPSMAADIYLKQASPATFFFADGSDQQIEFETGSNNTPVKVWHTAWGIKKELQKIE